MQLNMKRIIIQLIFLFNSITIYSQSYDFINDVIKHKYSDTIKLKENFNVDFRIETNSFDEYNIREWWKPFPGFAHPSIEPFLNNFNLGHLRSDLLNNKNDTLIDFSLLEKRFIPITKNDLEAIRENMNKDENIAKQAYTKYLNKSYIYISKPVFNCSKNWAVIITESFNPYFNIASGGYFKVYRRVDGEWVLYHKFELWMS